ncbi:uncharacterized protein [Lepeophtheirus salmonis]|uniref:uncharacterized protein n=1 Tax=Lepeophtheirus salmonis TaxID=72036 RepID=UPI001AEAC7AB|nr:cell adhesion molecule 1-like [Lepeophtheirus salmonis]
MLRTYSFWPFLLLLLATLVSGDYEMSATGGGIVLPGKSYTLTASTNTVFDRCYWYFPPERDYCIFGDGKVIRCSNDSLKAKVNYTGTDSKVCEITYDEGKDMQGGDFECTMDGATPNGKIAIMVAHKIEKMEIRVGNESEGYLEAGKIGTVFCLMSGGKPVGISNLTTSGNLNITAENSSVIESSNGEKSLSHKILVNVTPEDHGASIKCEGKQYDKSDPPTQLFETMSIGPQKLAVVFPPQPLDPLSFNGELAEEVKVIIPIHSNPNPTTLKWMAKRTINGSEELTELKNNEKIKIPKICKEIGEHKVNCSLTFKALATEDIENVSYELQAENKFGQEIYSFKILTPDSTTLPPQSTTSSSSTSETTTSTGKSSTSSSSTTPGGSSSTTTPTPEGGGTSSYVIPLVIFIVIIVVLIGGMIAYKRYSAKRQTAPLSMQ